MFGILGAKTTKWGRDPIVIGGFIIHVVSYFLIFLNLPNNSPFGDTHDDAFITSNEALAIFCSFLLGFGDACYNTQIYSILGGVYKDNSASAFAIFKFTQVFSTKNCFLVVLLNCLFLFWFYIVDSSCSVFLLCIRTSFIWSIRNSSSTCHNWNNQFCVC